MKLPETPYDKRILELENYAKELTELKTRRAVYLCPFNVGDVLISKRGKVAKIADIGNSYNGYMMHGEFRRKDGTYGRYGELSSWDEWKLLEEK